MGPPQQVFSVTQTTDSGLTGYRGFSDFHVAVDSSDNPHVTWLYKGASTSYPDCSGFNGNQVYYTSYNGSSWEAPVNVSDNTTNSLAPDITVDSGGNAHLVWSDGITWSDTDCSVTGTRAVYHKMRYSNGAWASTQPVTATDYFGSSPAIDADQNGEVHLLYSGQNQLEYAYWDGAVWSSPGVACSEGDSYYYIDVTVSGNNDVHGTYAVYGDFGAGSVYQIRYVTLEGVTWSSSEVVSLPPDNAYMKIPAVVVDSQNNPQVLWYDSEVHHILYRQKTSAGWSSTVQVSTDGNWPEDKGTNSLCVGISSDDRSMSPGRPTMTGAIAEALRYTTTMPTWPMSVWITMETTTETLAVPAVHILRPTARYGSGVNPGVIESQAAGNCDDGKDDELNDRTDGADPDCTAACDRAQR